MTEQMLQVAIHPSEFPDRMRAAVVNGLKQRRIPGRLLYQLPGQAQRWLDYHQAFSPSRTDDRLRDLYRKAFSAAFVDLGGKPLVAISLGCGGGHKDGDLFDALDSKARPWSRYIPLDTSPALVMEAWAHVIGQHPGLGTHPLVADLEAQPDIKGWLDTTVSPELPRLFCAFGLIPNMEPGALLAYLHSQLRPGDRLLLSANQSPAGLAADRARILPQYDNALARAWYEGALDGLGVPGSKTVVRIEAAPMVADGEWWRVEVRAHAQRDLSLRIFGMSIAWSADQPLLLFHSNRLTPQALRGRLRLAELEATAEWQGASGEEGIYLVRTAG